MEILTLAFSFASRMICEDIWVCSEVQTDAVIYEIPDQGPSSAASCHGMVAVLEPDEAVFNRVSHDRLNSQEVA